MGSGVIKTEKKQGTKGGILEKRIEAEFFTFWSKTNPALNYTGGGS
jgi:hypothetical protein